MNKTLSDLIQKKQKPTANNPVDWDDRRNKYIAAVKALYEQINGSSDKCVLCQVDRVNA